MKIIHGRIGCKRKISDKGICVAIGNFDGIHIGHQSLIKKALESNLTSMVMTFYPHPSLITKPNFEYYFLTNKSEKIEQIRNLNPNYLFMVDFDIKGASKSPDEFISWLKSMNVLEIVCGSDYRFGHHAKGSISDLEKHFKVILCDNVNINNNRVSSTNIKSWLKEGKIELANKALGRNYRILGLVVHGSQIGIKLGFPTANIDTFGNIVPKDGVYAVRVIYNKKIYYGMANIGHNPTCNYQLNQRLEVHLFDFDGNLYDKNVYVEFVKFWRDEKKFICVNELIEQLNNDKNDIKRWFYENKS